jgi:hypothetical protein
VCADDEQASIGRQSEARNADDWDNPIMSDLDPRVVGDRTYVTLR